MLQASTVSRAARVAGASGAGGAIASAATNSGRVTNPATRRSAAVLHPSAGGTVQPERPLDPAATVTPAPVTGGAGGAPAVASPTAPAGPFPGAVYAGQSEDGSATFWYDPAQGLNRLYLNGVELGSFPSNPPPGYQEPSAPIQSPDGVPVAPTGETPAAPTGGATAPVTGGTATGTQTLNGTGSDVVNVSSTVQPTPTMPDAPLVAPTPSDPQNPYGSAYDSAASTYDAGGQGPVTPAGYGAVKPMPAVAPVAAPPAPAPTSEPFMPTESTENFLVMGHGGLLVNPVYGIDLVTGQHVLLAESGPERVTPTRQPAATRPQSPIARNVPGSATANMSSAPLTRAGY